MELSTIPNFFATKAGKAAAEDAGLNLESLSLAEELYRVYNGGPLPSLASYKLLEPSEEFQSFTKQFSDSIKIFLAQLNDKDASKAFENSSWDGLHKEIEAASNACQEHQKRRRWGKKPTERDENVTKSTMTSTCLEFLIHLVPEGEYASLLSGSLTLAFNAAKRKAEIRSKILNLFDSLSSQKDNAIEKIKLYRSDANLHAKSEALYMAVIDCIRHCTTWLDSNSAKESFKAFFHQSQYGKEIDVAKQNMTKKVEEFETAIDLCFKHEVRQIHDGIKWMKSPMIATYAMLAGVAKDFPNLLTQLHEIRQQIQNQPPVIQYVQIPVVVPQVMPPVVWTSQLRYLLAVEWQSLSPEASPDLTASIKAVFEDDITTALRHLLSPFQQEQMGLLMTNERFGAWLRILESTFLILNDEGSQQTLSDLSTLSHLCGLVCKTLQNPGIWTLSFFCGRHMSRNAILQGARGLMRSITLQLLDKFGETTFQMPGVDLLDVSRRLTMQDLTGICLVFSMLLRCLPPGMVYILVDGAYHYETQAQADDMRTVMRFLDKVMRKAPQGVVLKILVANATPRQRHIWAFTAESIDLEQQILAGGHRGSWLQDFSTG